MTLTEHADDYEAVHTVPPRPSTRPSITLRRIKATELPASRPITEGPGHADRPVQAAREDRRGRHGHRLHGRAGEARPAQVALKIIKPGMDTEQVVARFEAERQALAMMDHPNIARVFDAGATDSGRPYFVMELVKGVPITDYCDAAQL